MLSVAVAASPTATPTDQYSSPAFQSLDRSAMSKPRYVAMPHRQLRSVSREMGRIAAVKFWWKDNPRRSAPYRDREWHRLHRLGLVQGEVAKRYIFVIGAARSRSCSGKPGYWACWRSSWRCRGSADLSPGAPDNRCRVAVLQTMGGPVRHLAQPALWLIHPRPQFSFCHPDAGAGLRPRSRGHHPTGAGPRQQHRHDHHWREDRCVRRAPLVIIKT